MVDDDRNAAVDREIQQAQQALDDAAKAQDADLSDAAVINRLYYAAFHSVQAVLYDREFDPSSHGGVLSLFGSEVIAVGDASRDDGRFFSQLSELRQQADYGYDELDENVDDKGVTFGHLQISLYVSKAHRNSVSSRYPWCTTRAPTVRCFDKVHYLPKVT